MNNPLQTYLKNHLELNIDDFMFGLDWENVIADLFISNQCQLNCKHCYFGKTKNNSNSLSISEWINSIDKLYKLGIRHFHFSGKESSLYEDSITLMKHIKSKTNTYAGLVSNGLGKQDYYKRLLDTSIDYIEFSIDGTTQFHNHIRGEGTFESTLKSIHTFSQEDRCKINITTCLNKFNKTTYFDLLEIGYGIGIKKYFLTPFYTKGNGEIIKDYSISLVEYSDFIEETILFLKSKPNLGLRLKYCIPKEYMTHIWDKSNFLKSVIINYFEYDKDTIFRINGNVLELSFLYFDIDYLNNLSITNDGFILPCADDIANKDYPQSSLGNIRELSSLDIEYLRKETIYNQIKLIE